MPIAKADDINIEYYIEGEGPPLLMIMGLAGQASSWGEPILAALRPHFQTIRFSNRGTGLSDKPDMDYTIRMMADDAAALLRELKVRQAHVFGVSMGGMIAQELVLNYPEFVRGLVLGCTTPGWRRGVTAGPSVWATLAPLPGLPREEQIRKTWPVIVGPEFLEQRRDFLEEMLRIGLANPIPIYALARQTAAVRQFDSYDRLPAVRSPTLIIHGDQDQLVPVQNARILQERIAGARLRILPGAGHAFFWEQPAEAAGAIVEFLSAVPVPA